MRHLLFKIRADTAPPANATRGRRASAPMPIESPSPIGSKRTLIRSLRRIRVPAFQRGRLLAPEVCGWFRRHRRQLYFFFFAPPRHPAPGGTNRRSYFAPSRETYPLSVHGHCDRFPATGERDHLPSTLWLANKTHARARNGQRTNASCRFPESGQTDGFRCRIGTPFTHGTPHQRSPRIRRWAYPWRSHPAEIRSAETASTSPAYGTETPVLPLAFNRSGVSRHPVVPRAVDQARISEVIQDSDFRTEIAFRKKPCFSAVPPCVRRTPGDFPNPHRFQLRQSNT